MPGAVREIQQTKGETRRFLVSLHRRSFPLVIPVTGAGKHGFYLRDLKVKWRHEARSPDTPALGIGEQAGTPQPLWLPHTSAPWAKLHAGPLDPSSGWLWEPFPWNLV